MNVSSALGRLPIEFLLRNDDLVEARNSRNCNHSTGNQEGGNLYIYNEPTKVDNGALQCALRSC